MLSYPLREGIEKDFMEKVTGIGSQAGEFSTEQGVLIRVESIQHLIYALTGYFKPSNSDPVKHKSDHSLLCLNPSNGFPSHLEKTKS